MGNLMVCLVKKTPILSYLNATIFVFTHSNHVVVSICDKVLHVCSLDIFLMALIANLGTDNVNGALG